MKMGSLDVWSSIRCTTSSARHFLAEYLKRTQFTKFISAITQCIACQPSQPQFYKLHQKANGDFLHEFKYFMKIHISLFSRRFLL